MCARERVCSNDLALEFSPVKVKPFCNQSPGKQAVGREAISPYQDKHTHTHTLEFTHHYSHTHSIKSRQREMWTHALSAAFMGFDRLEWQKVTHSTRVCNIKAACTQRHECFCCCSMMQVLKHPWIPPDSVSLKTKTSIFVPVREKADRLHNPIEQWWRASSWKEKKGGGGSSQMADCSCREYRCSWRVPDHHHAPYKSSMMPL